MMFIRVDAMLHDPSMVVTVRSTPHSLVRISVLDMVHARVRTTMTINVSVYVMADTAEPTAELRKYVRIVAITVTATPVIVFAIRFGITTVPRVCVHVLFVRLEVMSPMTALSLSVYVILVIITRYRIVFHGNARLRVRVVRVRTERVPVHSPLTHMISTNSHVFRSANPNIRWWPSPTERAYVKKGLRRAPGVRK